MGVSRGVWRWRGAGPGLAVTTPRTRAQPWVETPVANRIALVAFWGKQRSHTIQDISDRNRGCRELPQPL